MQRSLTFLLTFLLLGVAAAMPAAAQETTPFARYSLSASSEDTLPPVPEIVLQLGPAETVDGDRLQWWELQVIDPLSKVPLRVQLLSDQVPLRDGGGLPDRVARYLLHEEGRPALEYVDAETGDALLPRFRFLEHFLPNPTLNNQVIDGWLPTGKYIGHALELQNTGTAEWQPLDGKRLVMNRNMLIGTARTMRDEGSGRFLDYKQDDYPLGEYRYIPWTEQDYRDLIAAGHNYFSFREVPWDTFYDDPIFIRIPAQANDYPNTFYRSSWMGPRMFIDEPAVRMGETFERSDIENPESAGNFMTTYVATQINEANEWTEQNLRGQKVPLGDMDLSDQDIPSWDTNLETIFYQMAADISGLMHEGRYNSEDFNRWMETWFGPGFFIPPDDMLEFRYGIMRGAARSYDKDWGTAVYGQMDPNLRPFSLTKAYDMGARYLWFWTSDHDHHVPHEEQLALASLLMEHARENPRPPVEELRDAADTVVLLPYGYILNFWGMWGQRSFRLDYANSAGVPYREVLASAAWEGITALRRGAEVDYAIDMPTFDPEGYERIVRVNLDATVENGITFGVPGSLDVNIRETALEATPPDATEELLLSNVNPVVDADLDEWSGARWVSPELTWEASGMTTIENPEDSDLSARFAFAYGHDNFYIAATVRDDVHYQPDTGWYMWRGDSIQVAFDPLDDGGLQGYEPDDIEITVALTEKGPSVFRTEGHYAGTPGEIESAEVAIERRDNRTVYEVAIPMEELHPVSFLISKKVRANFLVNDADEGMRDSFIQWTAGIGEGKNPEYFGAFAWEQPSAGESLPVGARILDVTTAGEVGDPLEFQVRTWAATPREVEASVQLSTERGKSVAYHQAGTLSGDQEFTVILNTGNMEAGRYRARLAIRGAEEGREIYAKDFPIYVFPRCDD